MKGNVNAKILKKNVNNKIEKRSKQKTLKKNILNKVGKKTFYTLIVLCILLLAQLSVIIYAKNENGLEETDNINNNKIPSVSTRSGMPDLICTIESEYDVEYTDHDSQVTVTITNVGTAEAIGDIWLIVKKDSETVYEDIVTNHLGIQQSEEVFIPWTGRTEKDYLWEATVDHLELIEELDEINNYAVRTIAVLNLHANTGIEDYYHYVGEESTIMKEHGTFVNSIDGNLFHSQQDLHVNAFQFNLDIFRVYNSQRCHILGPMGYGWTHNHDTHLEFKENQDIIHVDMDATCHYYTFDSGNYIPPAGVYDKLVKKGDSTYTLFILDGTQLNFLSNGKISQIIDKNSNTLTYSYAGNRLNTVTDSSTPSLSLTFTYTGNLITKITDPLIPTARDVIYNYDGNNNLISVTDPRGNAMEYQYDTNHRLEKYKDRVETTLFFSYYLAAMAGHDRINEVSRAKYEAGQWNVGIFRMYKFTYYAFKTLVDNALDVTSTIEYNDAGNPTHLDGPATGERIKEGDISWKNHRIISFTDLRSFTTICTYDDYGNRLSWTDPLGFTYKQDFNVIDGSGQYISLKIGETNKLGKIWIYNYDTVGNLIKITDPTGYVIDITYYSSGLMQTYSGPPSKTFYHDAHGNLRKVLYADTMYEEFTYNNIGWMLTEKDADGYITQYNQYDNNGNLLEKTDPLGFKTYYSYDKENRLTSVTNRCSDATVLTYNKLAYKAEYIYDFEEESTKFIYDKVGNLREKQNKKGISTFFEYNNLNRLIKITDTFGNYITKNYDKAGNVISKTNKNGATTEFSFDPINRRTDVIDVFNHVTTTVYNAEGQIVSEINARGFTTSYEYDDANRLTKITDAIGNIETKTYDISNNRLSQETLKDGTIVSYTYDLKNRVETITDPIGTIRYTYDGRGNKLTETFPDGEPEARIREYTYDTLGRLKTEKTPIGFITTYNYDAEGRITSIVDANGNSISYQYDRMGRIKKETTAMGKQINYLYDAEGNLIKRTDPNGQVTEYEYDNLNRRTKVKYSGTKYIEYQYDEMDNVVRTHNKGIGEEETIDFTYDEKGQIKSVRVYKPTMLGPIIFDWLIEYDYDEVGNKIVVRDPEGGMIRYQYDGLDRMISIVNPYDEIIILKYDSMSRLIEMIYANGITLTNTYSSCNCQYGRLINQKYTKTDGSILLEISYTYDSFGNVIQRIDNDGTTDYIYDNDDRLIEVTYPWGKTVSYDYDAVGNRVIMIVNGVTTTYIYDNDNKLQSSSDGTTIVTYNYDNNGNLVNKIDSAVGITEYFYDEENRIESILFTDSSTAEYTYTCYPPQNQVYENTARTCDGSKQGYTKGSTFSRTDVGGYRFTKTTTAGKTYYICDGVNVILEYDSNFLLQAEYTHGPGVDNPISMRRNDQTYYYIKDRLGSVVFLVDKDENIVQSYRYDAFGTIEQQIGSITNPFTYTGREYDAESGLYYYRARYYDHVLGRFLQKDPAGPFDGDGPNLYIYVKNNPVIFTDPYGRFSWLCALYFIYKGIKVYDDPDLDHSMGWVEHCYLGCYIRRKGCSYSDAKELATLFEVVAYGRNYYRHATGGEEEDIAATAWGWKKSNWGATKVTTKYYIWWYDFSNWRWYKHYTRTETKYEDKKSCSTVCKNFFPPPDGDPGEGWEDTYT